jgi:hypothetical protein
VNSVPFCSPFDEALAHSGPPGLFLPDREGRFRFDPEWTRDAWERLSSPPAFSTCWVLVRDHDTGFVNLVLSTSPALLATHPRADTRTFATEAEARAVWSQLGRPALATERW